MTTQCMTTQWRATRRGFLKGASAAVFGEKPMTLCIREGREKVNAVRRYNRRETARGGRGQVHMANLGIDSFGAGLQQTARRMQ